MPDRIIPLVLIVYLHIHNIFKYIKSSKYMYKYKHAHTLNKSEDTVFYIFSIAAIHISLEINDCAETKDLRYKLDAYKIQVNAHRVSVSMTEPKSNQNTSQPYTPKYIFRLYVSVFTFQINFEPTKYRKITGRNLRKARNRKMLQHALFFRRIQEKGEKSKIKKLYK